MLINKAKKKEKCGGGHNAYTWVSKYIIKFHNSVDLLKLNNENKREREREKKCQHFFPLSSYRLKIPEVFDKYE